MKQIVGLILIVLGVCLGLYVGLYVCLVGGIIGLIDQIKAPETSSMAIATSIVKILFSSVLGWMSSLVGILPGIILIKD
jgi:hypothetical protein